MLNENEWTHFTVTRENGDTLKLWESNHNTPILEYTDESPLDISRLYIRGIGNELAEWKIHDCTLIFYIMIIRCLRSIYFQIDTWLLKRKIVIFHLGPSLISQVSIRYVFLCMWLCVMVVQ